MKRRSFIGNIIGALAFLPFFGKAGQDPAIGVSNGFRRLSESEREKLLKQGIRSWYIVDAHGSPKLMTYEVKNIPGKFDKTMIPDFASTHDPYRDFDEASVGLFEGAARRKQASQDG